VLGTVTPATRLATLAHAHGARLLLDGSQAAVHRRIDVQAIGCDFYAASGQKWLCGPGGMGYLYADPELVPDLPAPWSGYHAMEWSDQALVPALHPDARRLSTGYPAPHHVEWSHASLDVFEEAGFDEVHEHAANLAESFAEMLLQRGIEVAPRGLSTLVSFEVSDPEAFAQRAADEGIVIRHLPGRPWARASVGAWNTREELERLAELASRP